MKLIFKYIAFLIIPFLAFNCTSKKEKRVKKTRQDQNQEFKVVTVGFNYEFRDTLQVNL